MRFLHLIWAAVWRKPGEATLIGLAVTAAFTLFGLMLGLHASYQEIVDSSSNDRLTTDPRFPLSDGLRLPISMRDQIARVNGVTAVGALYQLRGYYHDPHNVTRILAVDEPMQGVVRIAHHCEAVEASQDGTGRRAGQPQGRPAMAS